MSILSRLGFVVLFVTIFAYHAIPVNAISFEEYVTLSANEKFAFDKFKSKVQPKLVDDFMKEDIYLIRWLRNAKFDPQRAEKALFAYVKRRQDIKLDTIHEEDWTGFQTDYPFWMEGEDREGRPLLLFPLQDWDIRRAFVSGKSKKLIRWFEKMLDEANIKVRELQGQGKNVTQYVMVQSLANINGVEHINPTTVPFWLSAALSYESDASGMTDKIILIDSNAIFDIALTLMRPVLSPQTRNAITPIAKGKRDRVYEFIDPKYLPLSFGGTKVF